MIHQIAFLKTPIDQEDEHLKEKQFGIIPWVEDQEQGLDHRGVDIWEREVHHHTEH